MPVARLHPSLYGNRRLHEVDGERWVIFGGVRAILTDDDRVRVARDAFAGEIDAFRFESGVALFHDSLGTFAWSRGFLGRLARLGTHADWPVSCEFFAPDREHLP